MATLYFDKSNAGGSWHDSGKWWLDYSRTSPAGAIPTASDDVVLDDQSGNCSLAAAATCETFDMSSYGAYTFDGNLYVLTFQSSCSFNNASPTLQNIKLEWDASLYSSGAFYPQSGMTIVEFTLNQGGDASNKKLIQYNNSCTITSLRFVNPSALYYIEYENWFENLFIDGYAVVSGKARISSPSSFVSERMWFRTDFDARDFEVMSGYFGFGYDQSVTVKLDSDLTRSYGDRWHFYNSGGTDITITVETPDGQGYMNLSSGLYVESYGSGDLTVDWSGATMRRPASYSDYMYMIYTTRAVETAALVLDFGNGNEFAVQQSIGLGLASELRGGASSLNDFFLKGASGPKYIGPTSLGDTDPTNDELPGNIYFEQHSTGAFAYEMIYGINIAGDAQFTNLLGNTASIVIKTPAPHRSAAVFRGSFIFNNADTADSSYIETKRSVQVYGNFEVNSTAGGYTEVRLGNGFACEVWGDLDLSADAALYAPFVGAIIFHTAKGEEKTIQLGDLAHTALGPIEIRLDDDTDQGGSYEAAFESRVYPVAISEFKITNEVDEPMEVRMGSAGGENTAFTFSILTITGRGDVCAEPVVDDYAVHVRRVSGTCRINSETASYPSFARFSNIINVKEEAWHSTIFADDGTCFDGGGNQNISFYHQDGSLALCPESISFQAYRRGSLPAAVEVEIRDLMDAFLGAPVIYAKSSWLSAEIIGSKLIVCPNTTDLAVTTYTGYVKVRVENARRSPQTLAVNYQIDSGIVPAPTPSQVDFLVRRNEVFPDPEDVAVDNPEEGQTPVMAEIFVTGVPAWLDVEINPPSSSSSSSSESSSSSSSGAPFSDHQLLRLTVNAIGLTLPIGTYSAVITIDAGNANDLGQLAVELVVEEVRIVIEPESLSFNMKEGKTLPEEQTVIMGSEQGELDLVTPSTSVSWLDFSVDGSGNQQILTVFVNSNAQSLDDGTHTAEVTLTAPDASSPATLQVTLAVQPLIFALSPAEVEFVPTPRWLVSGVVSVRVLKVDYDIIEPAEVTGAPDWLDIAIQFLGVNQQYIIVSINQEKFDEIEDPAEYEQTLLVTARGNPVEHTLSLPVSIRQPAFFRRTDCDMDFVPKIEGTIIEECEVPPPPPPFFKPPTPPAVPGGGYKMAATFAGAPCLTCEMVIKDGGELGYLSPEIELECTEHGCYPPSVAGTYCGEGEGEDDLVVTSIELDACGHVCKVWCEEDDKYGDDA